MDDQRFIVLGAGLAGLAIGHRLGRDAIVLEANTKAGGLVRSKKIGDYWFDRTLRMLYFHDAETERVTCGLTGPDLQKISWTAWVETLEGICRYPFQMNLSSLDDPESIVRCLHDLAKATFGPSASPATNFLEELQRVYGHRMCDLFLTTFNEKLWCRPLTELAPSALSWTMTRPDFALVTRGAVAADSGFVPYNAQGWYPRPPAGAPVRGMEVLSAAYARSISDLRLGHVVTRIDLNRRVVEGHGPNGPFSVGFGAGCVATLPLTVLVRMCGAVPSAIEEATKRLQWLRVWSVAMCIRGCRPEAPGLWHYYADPSLIFTRLGFTHELDPLNSPANGWGLLAEIPEAGSVPPMNAEQLIERTIADSRRSGALKPEDEVVDARAWFSDPAYVTFTHGAENDANLIKAYLHENGLHLVGRYACWDYLGMSHVLNHGLQLADRLSEIRREVTTA